MPAHFSHHGDLATFLRGGGSTLFPEERELLGELAGCRLAHLLCNTGQDTLSLARLGATVTGVDISEAAITRARALADGAGITAHFVCMDVYEWLAAAAAAGERFERIFASYGVVCWLADLDVWAAGVAALLAPGGRFVLVEFHPVSNMFDRTWRLAQDYPAGGRLLELPGVDDYVGAAGGALSPAGFAAGVAEFRNPEPCYLYQWGLGEVVSALGRAGLLVETLREYPFTNGERPFAAMRELAGRRQAPPADVPAIPLMYGIAARRPAM